MPSKNMLPKGKRRQSVRAEYRKQRTIAEEQAEAEKARLAAAFLDLEVEPKKKKKAKRTEGDGLATFIFLEEEDDGEPTLEERIAKNDWITTRGASGSKVAAETYAPPRYANPYAEAQAQQAKPPVVERNIAKAKLKVVGETRSFTAEVAAKGMRLDAYLAKALPDVSRGRVQELVAADLVRVDGKSEKASLKLRGGETIEITGEAQRPPLRAVAEDIPLDVIYEDQDLAVVNKPAGMMVHAGSGSTEHNSGTLVNALLFRFGNDLSHGAGELEDEDADAEPDAEGEEESVEAEEIVAAPQSHLAELRPGIVHRLDKQTSGLIVVAKNDVAHRKLGEMFAARQVSKTYLALVQGWVKDDEGTVDLAIGRDSVRRTRMTTRRGAGNMRNAVSHWLVLERFEGPYGKFSLVEVKIETGRTHQIRVHMTSIGHPVVGDTLYGAATVIVPEAAKPGVKKSAAVKAAAAKASAKKAGSPKAGKSVEPKGTQSPLDESFSVTRNFLHAAELVFRHPRTGKELTLEAPLPLELEKVLERLHGGQ
ncbi:23S rRNA pseudouridine1911/1915/1917 synthase [Bryocella elongata]|uniref:23S rRNA pseudouridine1911/1915/1917 synthase n=1 Tax=Bryocella elongata TaxID=863522 RepID=A0A1H6BG71_9BACT|nr:23S rRNA pseudouridine1911/1915/1917 synthase [Bryocella elongata]